MKRALTVLLLAVGVIAGLAGTASAETPVPTAPLSAAGYDRPVWQGRYDTAGRPDTHPLFGTEYGLQEDEPGWDCRTSGNRVCGSASQHDAVKACVLYAQAISDLPGDPEVEFLLGCFDAAYDAPLHDAEPRVGEWITEYVEWYNHHALAGYVYDAGTWW